MILPIYMGMFINEFFKFYKSCHFFNRDENINNDNNDAILDITDTSSHRAKMTKAQVTYCFFY